MSQDKAAPPGSPQSTLPYQARPQIVRPVPPPVAAPAVAAPPVPAPAVAKAAPDKDAALAGTVAAAARTASKPATSVGGVDGFLRTTVLPRVAPSTVASQLELGTERRFEEVEIIGAGGMGEVALVDDRDIQRKVALKRLRVEARSQPALERFAEEVRIIGQLEHPNITPVYDVGIDEAGQHYFVMKFVDGETLESIIKKLKAGDPEYERRYHYEQRIDIFIGILNAVRYAHARGIIHRDIKPANIMVGKFGEVTVVDWGIAKKIRRGQGEALEPIAPAPIDPAALAALSVDATAMDPSGRTQHGALVGTPMYMSPEQAAGNHAVVDERSDIYSLSLVLFELLSLNHPLADKTSIEQVIAVQVTDGIEAGLTKIKVDLIKSGAPTDYASVISRGLQRETAQRFASVDALEEALNSVRDGHVPVTCHITLTKRGLGELTHFIDRRPMLFTALFATSVATVGGCAFIVINHLVHLMR